MHKFSQKQKDMLPPIPGLQKDTILKNSVSSFCMGVPDRRIRFLAGRPLRAFIKIMTNIVKSSGDQNIKGATQTHGLRLQ
jgi:hypothetical protein